MMRHPLDPPRPKGRALEAFEVARTALYLNGNLSGPFAARAAVQLHRISGQLHRLDETACNTGLTKRQESRAERLESEARTIADHYGLGIYHQSDPRGCSLYIGPGDELAADYSRCHAVVRLGA